MTAAGPSRKETLEAIVDVIKRAMLAKLPVSVLYEGSERLLCPYMVGRNKEGQLRMLCLQYAGPSQSGLQHKHGGGDWRCFNLDKISGVQLVFGQPWLTVPSALARPKCLDQIEMQVD